MRTFAGGLLAGAVLIMGLHGAVHAPRRMAITVDDLPLVHQRLFGPGRQKRLFRAVQSALEAQEICATGFVNGQNVRAPFQRRLLADWVRAGHGLGNHTFSHPDLNHTAAVDFIADVRKGEEGLKGLWEKKYFRYPCLHRGPDLARRHEVSRFLRQAGYTVVPVTIDNDDYAYNARYEKAWERRDREGMERVVVEYLEHMRLQADAFDRLALARVGRSVPHILLLHMNLLNARCLPALLAAFRMGGWSFVTLEEALDDPVYALPEVYTGPKGVSWLERIEVHEAAGVF